MKNLKHVKELLMTLIILLPNLSWAQEDYKACQLILQEGLYRQYKLVKTGSFLKDLKTYLSSEEFKKDYHEGSWAGKIGVVIDGVPLELGANSSEADLTEFQRKVTHATSLTLTQSFYDYSSTSVPDVELAKAYTDCVIGSRRYGFKVTPRISEKNVFFVINYFKGPNETAGMPKIRRFDLKGCTNVTKSFNIGDNIGAETSISADRDPEKDLIMILETDRGVATYIVPAEPSGFNRDFPVGTIISSYLNWTEFQAASKNNFNNPSSNAIWTSRYSKWAPADGRQVPNSSFQKVASQNNVPDLRGQFLRGLNQFDNDQSTQVDDSKKDPDNRTRGSFQDDRLEKHSHTTAGHYLEVSLQGPQSLFRIMEGTGSHETEPSKPNVSADETRPKNVAIFYYIRIN